MIRLTRLRQTNPFYVNPDHIERIEHHHDTHVHLFNGTEFVVSERPEEIVALVSAHRANVLAGAARLNAQVSAGNVDDPRHDDPLRDDPRGEVASWPR